MSFVRKIDETEGFDARSIANFILDNFDSEKHKISNLKLNKILYYVHGIYSARHSARLIRNHIEAWENGPVIRVVFDSFKENGRDFIKNRANTKDYINDKMSVVGYDSISEDTRHFILRVSQYYMTYSASDLVAMTHEHGTPWHSVYNEKAGEDRLSDRIPEHMIRNFFVDNFGKARNH